MYTWEDFLNEYCGCSCDEVGNRPCDNGLVVTVAQPMKLRRHLSCSPPIRTKKEID